GLLFFVTGLRAARVASMMERFDVPVDLVDAVSVRFEGRPGAVGVLGSTGNLGVGDGGQHDLRVYCADGYLLLDMVAGTLTGRSAGVRRYGRGPSSLAPRDDIRNSSAGRDDERQLAERLRPLDDLEDVALAIREEADPPAVVELARLAVEGDALRLQLLPRGR